MQSETNGMNTNPTRQTDDFSNLGFQEVDQMDHDQALIEERNAGMRQITEDLSTMHEIFADVAKMVGDQGQELEHVEETVHQTNISVIQATEELKEASSLQKSARNKKICIVFIALVGLAIIGGIIGFFVWFALK